MKRHLALIGGVLTVTGVLAFMLYVLEERTLLDGLEPVGAGEGVSVTPGRSGTVLIFTSDSTIDCVVRTGGSAVELDEGSSSIGREDPYLWSEFGFGASGGATYEVTCTDGPQGATFAVAELPWWHERFGDAIPLVAGLALIAGLSLLIVAAVRRLRGASKERG